MSTGREAELLRQRAYAAVARALKRGTLRRLDCVLCGKPGAHAHHRDYGQPLEVDWLCASCHRREHTRFASHSWEALAKLK